MMLNTVIFTLHKQYSDAKRSHIHAAKTVVVVAFDVLDHEQKTPLLDVEVLDVGQCKQRVAPVLLWNMSEGHWTQADMLG